MEAYKILYPLIKHFVEFKFFQYKGFNKKEATSVFCSASSIIRKNYTIERVENIIRKLQLPLTIEETDLEKTSYFKIRYIEPHEKQIDIFIKSLKEVEDFEAGKKQPQSFDNFIKEL